MHFTLLGITYEEKFEWEAWLKVSVATSEYIFHALCIPQRDSDRR